VQGSIAAVPGEPQQNAFSVQAAQSAKLTLTWSSKNAKSVNIAPLGTGLPPSGSRAIPTRDGTFTLVAIGTDGSRSSPVSLEVHTHPDGALVSAHAELHHPLSPHASPQPKKKP